MVPTLAQSEVPQKSAEAWKHCQITRNSSLSDGKPSPRHFLWQIMGGG